jgi:hypothetical protein
MSCDGEECNGGSDCWSGCAIEELPDVQQHLNSDGEPCDCGEMPPQPGLIHYRRSVGVKAAPVAYTPPKYGPPPGFPAEKWRTMNRAQRREQLKSVARAVNQVVK